METKACNGPLCKGKEKDIDNFYSSSVTDDGIYDICKECSKKLRIKHQNRMRTIKISFLIGSSCENCSEDDTRLLDFAHYSRENKTHEWSRAGIHAMNEEKDKGRYLCVWCHREETYNESQPKTDKKISKVAKYVINTKISIGECETCNVKVSEDNFFCFDFDHIDRNNKTKRVSKCTTINECKKEIEKCRLLCCKCHRLHTLKQLDHDFNDYNKLDIEIENILCNVCLKNIAHGHKKGMCKSCYDDYDKDNWLCEICKCMLTDRKCKTCFDCFLKTIKRFCEKCNQELGRTRNKNNLCENCNKKEYSRNIKNPKKYCEDCGVVPLYSIETKRCRECYKKSFKKPQCIECNKELYQKKKTGMCAECYKKSIRKVEIPPIEQLEKLIKELGYKAVGRMFNVSDNAVRKWIKKSRERPPIE